MLLRTAARQVPAFLAAAVLLAGCATAPRSTVETGRPEACRAGYVGLSYDDGPIVATRAALLRALTASRARATFFEVGDRARESPELVRATLQTGMWIGNHSLTHAHLTQVDVTTAFAEIASTQFVLRQVTGRLPEFFRPPYGEINDEVRREAARADVLDVLWSVDSRDWAGATAAEIRAAAARLQPGEIILMHDGYQATIDAVPLIMGDLARRGLCAGRIERTTKDVAGAGTVFHAVAVKP